MELDATVELEWEMLEQAESLEQTGTSKLVMELMGWVELVNSGEVELDCSSVRRVRFESSCWLS